MFGFSLIDFNLTPLEIAGNILTLIGMSLFLVSSLCKKKRDLVLFQTGNHALSVIGQSFLGQVSGAIQDGVSIVRNIFILTKKNNKFWNIFFIVLGVVLGTVFNVVFQLDKPMMILIGFLPVIASFQYSIVVLLPNMKVPYIKLSMMVSCACWCVYGLFLKNYSMAVTNAIIFISSFVSLVLYFISKKKEEKRRENQEEETFL